MAVLALWLGWTIPALLTQQVAAEKPLWNAEQLLAALPPATFQVADAAPALLLGGSHCRCAVESAVPAGWRQAGQVSHLPFEWIVLDGSRQLVYAGPSLIPAGCGGSALPALPLVTRLLAARHSPVILADSCSCQQE